MGYSAEQEFLSAEHLMAGKNLQICATSLGTGKCRSRKKKKKRINHRDSIRGQSEWLRSKTQVITVAGENVEKPRHTSKISGTLSWNNHSGNRLGVSSEN